MFVNRCSHYQCCSWILGIIAVVIVLLGGFKYMISGNEEKTTEAKNLIVSGIIGLAIILSAWAITGFVISKSSPQRKTRHNRALELLSLTMSSLRLRSWIVLTTLLLVTRMLGGRL